MRVRLDYGRTGIEAEVPNGTPVLGLREMAPLADAAGAVREALARPIGSPPLREVARERRNAVIVHCDITRPVPNPVLLPEILRVLDEAGIPRERVTLLNATGTHRPNDAAELRGMLGDEAVERCRLVNHVCTDDADMVPLGTSPNGVPIRLNRRYVEADLKITVGMIEPHFMAGFAGGRKMVMPGVAALETVQAWHSPRFLEHPLATNGAVEGNPVHEEALWIANRCRPDFIVDVALNARKEIARVFAGDMEAAWTEGTRFVAAHNVAELEEPVDVVLTSCGGYPLDLTYYQTVKGMVGALPILKPDGDVVVVSACEEGVGNLHFRDALLDLPTLDDFLQRIAQSQWRTVADQWQIEELARAVRGRRVFLKCEGISPELVGRLFVHPVEDLSVAVARLLAERGAGARLAVIPKGPYVIPRVRSETKVA